MHSRKLPPNVRKAETGRFSQEAFPFALALITVCSAFAFASWTLACHLCVAWHLPFRTLAHIGPAALVCGIVCGVFAARASQRRSSSQLVVSSNESQRPGWIWIAIAAGVVAARALGVGYPAFWIACVLLLSRFYKIRKRGGDRFHFRGRTCAACSPTKAILLALIFIAPAITYVSHRPNIDDAVYIGTAAERPRWQDGIAERAALTLAPALYPLACGLSIARGFRALEGVFAYLPVRAELAATMVFSPRTENAFLFALLAAPFLERTSRLRRRLVVPVLTYFLASLNPFTFKLLSKFTTRDAVWRVLWCAPVAGIVATATAGGFQAVAERWGKRGIMIAVVLLLSGLVYLAPYSSFSTSTGIRYSLKPLKVVAPDYAAAREAIAATPPNSSVLAPENVAVWIPTFIHRVPLVSVREIYDGEMGTHMAPEEARTRRELRELVSGREFPAEHRDELLNRLPNYSVGLIITTKDVAGQLDEVLLMHGYSRNREVGGYIFFRRPS